MNKTTEQEPMLEQLAKGSAVFLLPILVGLLGAWLARTLGLSPRDQGYWLCLALVLSILLNRWLAFRRELAEKQKEIDGAAMKMKAIQDVFPIWDCRWDEDKVSWVSLGGDYFCPRCAHAPTRKKAFKKKDHRGFMTCIECGHGSCGIDFI